MAHRLREIAALCLSIQLLTGCVDKGIVISKEYDASYTWFSTQCVQIGNNACGTMTIVPHFEPECWRLDLRDGADTGSVCVDRNMWGQVRIGQYWTESKQR